MFLPGRSDTDTAEVYGLLQSGLQQAGKGAGEYQPADGESSTLYLSGSHQSYWGTDRTDRQLNAGFNSSVNDISWSLNYSLSRNAWQHETDRILSFDVSIPFSHWMRSDSTSAWRNASARYSQTLEAHGQAASTAGLYGTLLEDNNLGYSIQSGYTREGMRGAVKQDMPL